MENFIHFFENLGIYIIPTILVLFFIVAIIVIFCFRKNKKTENKDELDLGGLEKQLIENSETAFLVIRKYDYMPVYASPNFKNVVGLDFQDIVEDFEIIATIFDEDVLLEVKDEYLKQDKKGFFKKEFKNKITKRWLRLKTVPKAIDGYDIISFLDISDFVEEVIDIKDKLIKAEITSRSKTEFLSKMSHDIRTPMNGILGMLTLMKINLKEDNNILQYIEKAESLSHFLLNLINDILDISRIEANKIVLAKEPFNLCDFSEKFNLMFRKTIEEKGIKFNIELDNITNPCVIGDEFRISQVLINFISNSIKFTEKGEISLKIGQVGLFDGVGSYLFNVKDTGKGMDPNFIKDIFKPFEQEDAKIARKYGGSGLGMAIADQMVHLMNGEIVVDSMLNSGTEFTVYLDLPIVEESKDTSTTDDEKVDKQDLQFEWKGIKILLAEDNAINAEIFVEMMEIEEAIVDVAVDGEDVIQKFAEQGKDYYDVILMDIQMPVRNGWDAAKIIRGMKEINGDIIPIFALSADAFIEDRRKSLEVGMNGHIAKPIDFGKLKETVGEALRSRCL